MKRFLLELNLFTKNSISDRHVRQQQIATRAYIALVSFAFAILALYSSLNSEIYQEVVNNPTLAQFSLLRSQYPTSLQCPCSSISAEYSAFLTVEPHYHQICSSNFISTSWIAYTNEGIRNNEFYDPEDYRQNAGSLFQLLATFCQQAQQTINDALQLFLKEHFVTSDVISEDLFKAQTNKFIEDWQFNTMNSFFRPLQLIRNVQQGNQIMTPTYNFNLGFISDFGFVSVTSKEYEIIANETSPDSTFCLCSISTFCRKLMPIRDLNISTGLYQFRLYVPNFYIGCFRIEAMFMSTLECFYSETCINTLASFMLPNAHNVTWVPLNDSQNPANEMLESIITRLFVDDWSNRTSFSDYYIVCAPQSCTYDIMRRRTLIPLITLIISIFGGLTTGLKILFSILLHILGKVRAERNLKNQLTAIRLWFRSINNQEYLSNRLKIVFLVVTLSALYFTSAITLIPQTEHVLKPPLGTYEQLLLRFPHTLQCPCSQVSVKYGSFLNLSSARRHQVCASDFVSDRWIATLYLSYDHLGSSQSKFSNAAIGFFQLVASLCELTEQIVSDSLSQLAGTYLFQYHVLSRAEFNRQVQLMVEQFQLNPSDSFLITLELIREMMSTNSLMTLFRTNWRFTDVIGIPYDGQKIQTEPVSYGTCDCGLSAQCVELAKTEDNNPLPGLFVGCYPLESLLKSTLECFYNGSCLEELQLMNTSFTQLDNSLLRQFEENSTLEFLLSRLMVDGWSSNVSYENYYDQCAPSSCWYSYFEHRPAVEVITSLLALYGGLVVITNVVVSMLLALWRKVIQQRPRQIQTTVTLFIFT